ncbi:MAG TPA: SPOR domain-containing protein [Paracoccaceae bacterium]|nr:SPOR domain-containing protein [Paracoccaceae bacterium]
MSDIYADDFASDHADGRPAISPAIRRAAGAALFLVLVIGMAVWAYRLGTRDATEVPIIRAMEEPARVQPDDPGGIVAAHQGLEVNSVLAGEPAPVPDAANPPAIHRPEVTLQPEDGPQGELVVATPEIPPMTLGADDDLRMPPPESGPELAEADPAPASHPGGEVAALIEAALRGAEAAAEEESATALVAGPRPRGRPAGLASRPARAEAPAPQSLPPASPAPTSAAAAREVASVAPGSRLVQLGAFDSEGLARQVWSQLTQAHGDLLGSRSLFLERATHNARVFYRLRVAGFSDVDETRIVCERLRDRGVDCIPVQMY